MSHRGWSTATMVVITILALFATVEGGDAGLIALVAAWAGYASGRLWRP